MLKRKAKRITVKTSKAETLSAKKGFGHEMPPDPEIVDIYFDEKGFSGQSSLFYDHFQARNWCCPKGTPYRNWKVLACDWIFDHIQILKWQRRQRAGQSILLTD